jgi:hypothetical protein
MEDYDTIVSIVTPEWSTMTKDWNKWKPIHPRVVDGCKQSNSGAKSTKWKQDLFKEST